VKNFNYRRLGFKQETLGASQVRNAAGIGEEPSKPSRSVVGDKFGRNAKSQDLGHALVEGKRCLQELGLRFAQETCSRELAQRGGCILVEDLGVAGCMCKLKKLHNELNINEAPGGT